MSPRATTPVRLAPDARNALRQLAFRLTGATMRQVDMSEALIAACAVAQANFDQALAALPEGTGDDDQH